VVQLLSPEPVLPLNVEFPEKEIQNSTDVPGARLPDFIRRSRQKTYQFTQNFSARKRKNTARTYLDYSPR